MSIWCRTWANRLSVTAAHCSTHLYISVRMLSHFLLCAFIVIKCSLSCSLSWQAMFPTPHRKKLVKTGFLSRCMALKMVSEWKETVINDNILVTFAVKTLQFFFSLRLTLLQESCTGYSNLGAFNSWKKHVFYVCIQKYCFEMWFTTHVAGSCRYLG